MELHKFINTEEEKGGPERIRTAVGAFAEPSLAARPRRHHNFGWQI